MNTLLLFLLAPSLFLLPLSATAQIRYSGLTAPKEVNATRTIYYQWRIPDWTYYIDNNLDPCSTNENRTTWPLIECTNCPEGSPSGSCHITSLNLCSKDINVFPSEIFDLQWLTNLSLCNNSISQQIPPDIDRLSNIAYLDLSMNNFSGKIPENISNLAGLTYLNLSRNMLSGLLPSKLDNLINLSTLDLSVNMLSGNLPSELGKLSNLRILKFSTNKFSGPIPGALGNLTSLQELYLDSSGVSGSLDVLEPLKALRKLWAFDNDIGGSLTAIGNFTKLEELRIYGTHIRGPIPHFSDPATIKILQIGDLLPSSGSSSPLQSGSDFSFLANMDNLRILSLRNCSLTGSIFAAIPGLNNLTYLDLSFNKLSGTIPQNHVESKFPNVTQLFIGGNKLDGSVNDIISKKLSTGELDISFNPISGELHSYPNLNINFLGTNINAQTVFSDSRSSDILSFIGNNSKNISNLSICSPFAIKCGADVHNISHLSYYHNDSNHLGAADFNIDNQYQWVVSNVGSFLLYSNKIDSIVNTEHIISDSTGQEIENQILYQTARSSASSLKYYIVGLPDGDGYTIEVDFAEIVIEEQNSWRGLGRRYFNILVQVRIIYTVFATSCTQGELSAHAGDVVERDFNIVVAANGSFKVVTRSYKNVTVRNRTVDVHFQWAGRGTCCVPYEYTYGPLVSAIRIKRDRSSSCPSPSTGKTSRQKTGVAVGILSLGIAGLLIFSSIMYLWWKWIRLGRVMKD